MDIMKTALLGIFLGLIHLPSYSCLSVTSNLDIIDRNVSTNDTIVFNCNGNISNLILKWYVNGETVATYTYEKSQSFPMTILPSSTIAGIKVQISSAIQQYGSVNYENFTLSIPQCNIVTLGELTVQCGNSFVQSNIIMYDQVNLTGTTRATSTAIYSGSNGLIRQIIVNLVNLQFKDVGCGLNTSYYINLDGMNTRVNSTIVTPSDCNETACTVSKPYNISGLIASSNSFLNVLVTVSNVREFFSAIFMTSALHVFGNSTINSCAPEIKCSKIYGRDCIIQYGSDPNYEVFDSTNTISPGGDIRLMSDTTSQTFVQITQENNNSKSVYQYHFQKENSPKFEDDNLLFIIGWIALIVGIILNVCGYIITGIYWKNFGSCGKMIAVGFLILSIILWVLSVSLLISYHIAYTQGSCGTKVRNLSIALSAACFCLLYCAYSACLTGAICIFPKINIVSGRSSRDKMKLTFGKNIRNKTNNKRCIDCNKEFALIQREQLCQSCSKYMCKDCGGISEAFIPRNMKMGITCRSCNREYCKENNKLIMKANSVAKLAKLQSEVADGACCVCNELKEAKHECSCCSQNICKNHSKKLPKEVIKEFSIDDGNYCHFCYEIYVRKYDFNKKVQTETKGTSL